MPIISILALVQNKQKRKQCFKINDYTKQIFILPTAIYLVLFYICYSETMENLLYSIVIKMIILVYGFSCVLTCN